MWPVCHFCLRLTYPHQRPSGRPTFKVLQDDDDDDDNGEEGGGATSRGLGDGDGDDDSEDAGEGSAAAEAPTSTSIVESCLVDWGSRRCGARKVRYRCGCHH